MSKKKRTLPPLFLIMGESGSGKDTLIDLICKETGRKKVKSFTTRPPRYEGENTHHFTDEKFFRCLQNGRQLAAYTTYDGYKYGATFDELERANFYIIDPQGAQRFKFNMMARPVDIIYITADEKVRQQRMIARGDGANKARRRLEYDEVVFDPVTYPIICASYVFDTSDTNKTPEQQARRLKKLVEKLEKAAIGDDPRSNLAYAEN